MSRLSPGGKGTEFGVDMGSTEAPGRGGAIQSPEWEAREGAGVGDLGPAPT